MKANKTIGCNKFYQNSPAAGPDTSVKGRSYGLRYWDGNDWMYLSHVWDAFSWEEPQIRVWNADERDAWTTTDLLDAMFQAQKQSSLINRVIEVAEFNEPRRIWSTSKNDRKLNLRKH